ncbi:MAG: class I SAM-dependent methyltransferase [Bacteroidota bacterium]|nr:class I SAM-dependent methyltransferase [Bacteroidota bacterium]
MFKDLELKNKIVLEGMCGSGQTTNYLLSKEVNLIGNDISDIAIERFKKRWPGCNVLCSSILNTGLENESVDCVVIVGGLHHLHPYLNNAIDEIYRILKIGGYFCFGEPHAGSLPDFIRKIWYKKDAYFENGEEAIELDILKENNSSRFEFKIEKYIGDVAYLFVLNSMIFRMPLKLKKILSPFLIFFEHLTNPFHGKKFSCFVVSQWRKK